MDGLVQIMEGAPKTGVMGGSKEGHWTDNGVDVQIHLTVKSMENLLIDPELHVYR